MVSPDEVLSEVVQKVTLARTGAAILIDDAGAVQGIFTDGDLRRAILQGGDVLCQPVGRFSTVPCQSICADTSVANAVRLMQQSRIEDLPVVAAKTEVALGLLCLKDVSLM